MLVYGQGVVEWVEQKLKPGSHYGTSVGLGWKRNGEIVCGVVYTDYSGTNINMHTASDGTKRWLTREFLRVVFDYPFNQLKVKRVTALVPQGNFAARKFDEHLGFIKEATLADAEPTGDLIVYVMRKENCRWLNANLYKARLAMAA